MPVHLDDDHLEPTAAQAVGRFALSMRARSGPPGVSTAAVDPAGPARCYADRDSTAAAAPAASARCYADRGSTAAADLATPGRGQGRGARAVPGVSHSDVGAPASADLPRATARRDTVHH